MLREKQKSLIIIKPDGIAIAGTIFSELDKIGERIETIWLPKINRHDLYEHYKNAIKKHGEFLRKFLEDYFLNKKIILALYEGERIIKKIKEKVGATDPSQAHPDTIRGKYSKDSLAKSLAEKRALQNLVHASDSLKEFKRELKVWKKYFD